MKRKQSGRPTNDLILSAAIGLNSDIFPQIADLYFRPGITIADVTFGKGSFWANVDAGLYRLERSDIQTGTDCRSLPYENGSFDAIVFDPPYMHTPGGTAHANHQNFESYYQNNATAGPGKYHEAVLNLYFATAWEAVRVLRPGGVFVVKCQDEVCSNRNRFTHIEIANEYAALGLNLVDIFILVRRGRPGVSRLIKQVHARKNHSYFLIFKMPAGRNPESKGTNDTKKDTETTHNEKTAGTENAGE